MSSYSYLLVMAVIWPIITALIFIVARTLSFSAGQHNTLLSLTPSYHKFHDEPKNTRSVDDSSSSNSDALINRLHLLAHAYPTYVTLTTTQDLFGEGGQQQHTYALIIQDKQRGRLHNDAVDDVSLTSQFVGTDNMSFKDAVDWFHTSVDTGSDTIPTEGGNEQEEKEAASQLPTTTHGDIILSSETLGSDKVFGLASVMLESANCESIPSSGSVDDSNDKTNYYLSTVTTDRRLQCRTDLNDRGVSTKDVEWLANLVFTRRTIVLPSAAAAATPAAPVSHHHHGSFNLSWLVAACVSLLLLTVTLLTLITVRRKKKQRNRIWLEEEAKRQIAEEDDNYEYYESLRKDFTSELTSFDEELTVQLIEPSHNVVLV
jgi:hypothetical protein